MVLVLPSRSKKRKHKYHVLTNPTNVTHLVKAFDAHTGGKLQAEASALGLV
jgi:hypothetical protein